MYLHDEKFNKDVFRMSFIVGTIFFCEKCKNKKDESINCIECGKEFEISSFGVCNDCNYMTCPDDDCSKIECIGNEIYDSYKAWAYIPFDRTHCLNGICSICQKKGRNRYYAECEACETVCYQCGRDHHTY